jgi:hypothetical protein
VQREGSERFQYASWRCASLRSAMDHQRSHPTTATIASQTSPLARTATIRSRRSSGALEARSPLSIACMDAASGSSAFCDVFTDVGRLMSLRHGVMVASVTITACCSSVTVVSRRTAMRIAREGTARRAGIVGIGNAMMRSVLLTCRASMPLKRSVVCCHAPSKRRFAAHHTTSNPSASQFAFGNIRGRSVRQSNRIRCSFAKRTTKAPDSHRIERSGQWQASPNSRATT